MKSGTCAENNALCVTQGEPQVRWRQSVLVLGGVLLGMVFITPACVSKSKADARARAAFLAGQQQAMQQMVMRGPTVSFIGDVRNAVVPWTAGLTLAQALLAAEYYGPDPESIVIRSENEHIQVDLNRLLTGEDIPLQP